MHSERIHPAQEAFEFLCKRERCFDGVHPYMSLQEGNFLRVLSITAFIKASGLVSGGADPDNPNRIGVSSVTPLLTALISNGLSQAEEIQSVTQRKRRIG